MKFTAPVIVLLLWVGCRDTPTGSGVVCTTEARVGIQVSIRDATTGTPAAPGAVAIAQEQSFVDTLRGIHGDSLRVFGAYERPGTYTVIISKNGYRDWIRTNIVVRKDECHVITVHLDANLERLQ